MPYADPIKRKEYDVARAESRRQYFRDYQRKRKALGLTNQKYAYIPQVNGIGAKGEVLAQSVLVGSKRIFHPCDLSWEGKLVEVKTSTKLRSTKSLTYKWKFRLQQLGKVDLFFIICLDLDKKVEHIFLIPDRDIKVKHLSISENKISKYSNYRLSLQ